MLKQRVELFGKVRLGRGKAGFKIGGDLAGKPGPAIAPSPDHHPVRPGLPQRLGGVLHRQNITIDQHRDAHSLLHLADEGPIGRAGVEHLAGAPMDGHQADTAFLSDLRQTRRVEAGVIPPHPHLQGDRHRNRGNGGREDRRRPHLVAHQRAAGLLAQRHLLHGAAEIDVDDRRAAIHRQLRRLRHHPRLAARELHRRGRAEAIHLGHLQGLAILPHHRLAGDHLAHHHPRPLRAGEPAEGKVRDPRHRGQVDGRLNPHPAHIDRDEARRRNRGRNRGAAHALGKLPAHPARRNANC